MINIENIKKIIVGPEDDTFELKTVLPPSKTMAMLIASFANTKGGHIILGIRENPDSSKSIVGLSQDFRAKEIVQKSLELMLPQPTLDYKYLSIDGKQIFVVAIQKSENDIRIEKQKYIRLKNGQITVQNSITQSSAEPELNSICELLSKTNKTTGSFKSLKQHYLNVVNIMNDFIKSYKNKEEISILKRILFSSCADNFEKYLSDLLFEIFLANPNTMKSEETVTIEEVLKCADIQEFIMFYADKKIQKLQKGNIKAFLKDTKPLADLKAVSDADMVDVNKILEIRHLFTHKNGVVDQKFVSNFIGVNVGETFEIDINDMCERICKLISVAKNIDEKAVGKHDLGTL